LPQLLPGHSKAIGSSGTAYIDDFEGSETTIDLRQWSSWALASTPQEQVDLWPEGNLSNDLHYGYNVLSWLGIPSIHIILIGIAPVAHPILRMIKSSCPTFLFGRFMNRRFLIPMR